MKWFKHMSDLRSDPEVADYLDQAGRDRMASYGFLMTLFEVVSNNMTLDDPNPQATYPLSTWRRLCDVSAQMWASKLRALCKVGVINVSEHENKLRVEIPKLLNLLDEYTRKSGATPDRIRSMSHKSESEREITEGEEERRGDISKEIASLTRSSCMNRSPLASQSLAEKVDALLDRDTTPGVFKDAEGRINVDLLALTIHQRDGKPGRPTKTMMEAVGRCVRAASGL